MAERNLLWNSEEQTFDRLTNSTDHKDVTLKSTASSTQIQEVSTISKLEQELSDGMAKLQLQDVNTLPDKIEGTEQRIKNHREDGQILKQLKNLTLLNEDITTLKINRSVDEKNNTMKINELEQELENKLAKLQIQDVKKLPEKIQWTEQRIKDHGEDGQILEQLKDLTLLNDKITELKLNHSIDVKNTAMKIDQLEQELVNGLAKLQVQDIKILPEKIQRTEQRVKDHQEDGQILEKMKNLTLLNDKITELKYTRPVEDTLIQKLGDTYIPRILAPVTPERCFKSGDYGTEPNDQTTTNDSNKRSSSYNAFGQSAKRFCEPSKTASTPQFFVPLPEVTPVLENPLLDNIRQKYRRLCRCIRQRFPGRHPICMHTGNYEMIVQSPYMVTWKSVGKRYLMLIEQQNKVYMLDQGDDLFAVDHIQFPCDVECTTHLNDTLVDGEFVIDKVDGSFRLSYLIGDIITYNSTDVRTKPLSDRLKVISQSIVHIRNSAITKGHIQKSTQPFSIRIKDFFNMSKVNKLVSPEYLATIPYEVDGFFFVPEQDPYTSGQCQRTLKWKEKETVEFRLEISTKNSGKQALLFLNHMDSPFATMPYLPTLQKYDNKIISCSYEDDQWHFHRLRDDRPFPNSKQSAAGVMNAMRRHVKKQVLCGLTNKSLENHVHGNNSSSTKQITS